MNLNYPGKGSLLSPELVGEGEESCFLWRRSRETKRRLGGERKKQKHLVVGGEWDPRALVFRPDPDSAVHH